MRRPRTLAVLAVAAVLGVFAAPAGAVDRPTAAAPNGSSNVQFIANIPEMASAISIGFIDDVMFVSTVTGLYSYDVSDPASPSLLGALPMYIWENEDMNVDPVRKLVFISRDPRGFTAPVISPVFPYGALHVIDVSNPHALVQIGFTLLPVGHTSTCINACRFIWTAGPAPGATDPADWGGRPVFATDLTDPRNPKLCPDPIDLYRNDGHTDYSHDVQVDAKGVAWVSGAGGVRGYWTSGSHVNPVTGARETATGCKPIPYAGGGTPSTATPSRFMHNAWRNVNARASKKAAKGTVLYATEENVVTNCATSGRFATYDLRGSFHGEGWRNIAQTHFRMKVLDTWTPEHAAGSTGCDSAHYFTDRGDGILAYAFYSQGVRFLDVSNPRNIRQIGWWHPSDTNTWAAYWHDGYIYTAEQTRGVDILKFQGNPGDPAATAPIFATAKNVTAQAWTHYTCQLVLPPKSLAVQ